MKYQEEQAQERKKNIYSLLKTIVKKALSILAAVTLVIVIIISINFFAYVVFGESTLTEFKNSFFGIPSNKLLKVNQQIHNQYNNFEQWFSDLQKRLSK
ncbi:MAG: hypothetical protein R6U54_05955 [Candidatus Omnitrophota bacterium]